MSSPSSSGSSATSCTSATSSGSPAPNAMPATNAAMKPLPSRATARAKLARAAASVARRRPPAMIHRRLEPKVISRAVPSPNTRPTTTPSASSSSAPPPEDSPWPVVPSWLGGHREREDDDRCGDAVVQTALHVQRSTQPQRYPLVVDHLRAEGGIRGSQRRPHETGESPGEVVEHHGSSERPEDHRERAGRCPAGVPGRRGPVSAGTRSPGPRPRTAGARGSARPAGGSTASPRPRRAGPTSDSPASTPRRRTRGRR